MGSPHLRGRPDPALAGTEPSNAVRLAGANKYENSASLNRLQGCCKERDSVLKPAPASVETELPDVLPLDLDTFEPIGTLESKLATQLIEGRRK